MFVVILAFIATELDLIDTALTWQRRIGLGNCLGDRLGNLLGFPWGQTSCPTLPRKLRYIAQAQNAKEVCLELLLAAVPPATQPDFGDAALKQ